MVEAVKPDHYFYVEKYRPNKVSDIILPDKIKNIMSGIVESGELPNMIFTGSAGLGKTTMARALCAELGVDYLIINGSEEGNIDTLRGKIKQFASTVSLQGGDFKVVILDEADYLNAQSTQPALRAFIEEFSDNCRFILTCNYKHRIIEPLHSRCTVMEFNPSKKDMPELCVKFLNRLKEILDLEGVPYEEQALVEIIKRYVPDWRRVLNEVQANAKTGNVCGQSLVVEESSYGELFKHLKAKNFKEVRQWVATHADLETTAILRGIYDRMFDNIKNTDIPAVVLVLAEYQYKDAFCQDKELNLVACMVELMGGVEFK